MPRVPDGKPNPNKKAAPAPAPKAEPKVATKKAASKKK